VITFAPVPDDFDQDATASFTAFVSASPLEPIMTVSGFFDEVGAPLVVLLPLLPNPDPQALRATAVAIASAPDASHRVRRCMVRLLVCMVCVLDWWGGPQRRTSAPLRNP
jgi:hypothetical protein